MVGLEEELKNRAIEALPRMRGIRSPETREVFERISYVFSHDLKVVNYPRRPYVAFNPGALLMGNELWVFPRLVFDYYGYTSSIGFFKLDVENLLSGGLEKPIETRVVLWPKKLWELKGCEDARPWIEGERLLLLYTGFGFMPGELPGERGLKLMWVQGLARLDMDFKVLSRGFFKIVDEGRELVARMKDSAFLKVLGDEAVMLCRPSLGGVEVCWCGTADMGELVLHAGTMKPVLVHEKWEFKVGWSTNVVKLSSNEYLVGWHGVLAQDYSYKEGLAILSEEGELLAISNYLLSPHGIVEEYGDRPLVIFGNGLVKYRDSLIWVGGVSDYGIGFFKTDLEKVLENLKWIKG